MDGYLGATRRFAIDFDAPPDAARPFHVQARGAAVRRRAGRSFARSAASHVDGTLPHCSSRRVARVGALRTAAATARLAREWSGAFAGADLDVAEFAVFGQQLGSTRIERAPAHRRLAARDRQRRDRGHDARADRSVGRAADRGRHAAPVLERRATGAGGMARRLSDLDPRELPGLQLHADEFGIGQRQIGRLDAEVLSDPLGLRLVSFESATDSFTAQGSGGWFVGRRGRHDALRR